MSRVIALDYGTKHVGVAVSDPLQLVAFPLKSVRTYEVIDFLRHYIAKENVGTIVVGWPLTLDGKVGFTARLVSRFMRLLQRYFPTILIVNYDERFTSVMAKQSLIQKGLKKKNRQIKGSLDTISATFILRSFMEKKQYLERKYA